VNRHDIQLLQSIRGYPALSVLISTHRAPPKDRQDPIRVKNLVVEAINRLLAEFSKRQINRLLARLRRLVAQIDYRRTLEGLALFVNRDFARKFYLPFSVKEKVLVDETFAVRDLVFALNHSPRYWVLVLSGKKARLFEGFHHTLIEVTTDGFPVIQKVSPAKPLQSGFGLDKSKHQHERHRQFLRRVDSVFDQMAAEDPLPLVVLGPKRSLAFFNEASSNARLIAATLTGHYDRTSAGKLADLVWPLIKADLARQKEKALEELGAAIGAQRYVSGIGEVWRLAQEGRAATLLVEEDFHYPGQIDSSGLHLKAADDPTAPHVFDDAVDELIQVVLAKNGRVVFVDNGALQAHQRVAVILRY
jgi:hypothetical protein